MMGVACRVIGAVVQMTYSMTRRTRLMSAAILMVFVVYFVVIAAMKHGERIMSRPKWKFDKDVICQGSSIRQVTTEELENFKLTKSLPGLELPSKEFLCSLTVPQLEFIYAWYFSNIQTLCGRLKRYGNLEDGGWDACLDKDLILKDNCLVYSFGISFDFSFDDEIAEHYGCAVHSFDPSMNTLSYKRSARVSFHNLGLSATNTITPDAKWRMLTFQDIREELNHGQIFPDMVKMDIEDWEWHVIPEMLRSNSFKGVKQFLIEFHFSNIPEADTEGFWLTKLLMIKDLYDLGYRTTWITRNIPNVWKSRASGKDIYGCLEVAFIRRS